MYPDRAWVLADVGIVASVALVTSGYDQEAGLATVVFTALLLLRDRLAPTHEAPVEKLVAAIP